MKLEEKLRDYDEFENEYVISYELMLDNGAFYNIELHQKDGVENEFYVFETYKNKYHNKSIRDKIKKELNIPDDKICEYKEHFMLTVPDLVYSYSIIPGKHSIDDIAKVIQKINL